MAILPFLWPLAWAAFVASAICFIVALILYLNPLVSKTYKRHEKSPAVKKWTDLRQYAFIQYLGILIKCLLWAPIFAIIKPALASFAKQSPLPSGFWGTGLLFWAILVAIHIFPRFFDMWSESTFPSQLLAWEVFNGTIGSLVVALVFAHFI